MLLLRKPDAVAIRAFLEDQAQQPFSYAEVGCTDSPVPAGYSVGHRRLCLGNGPAAFVAACDALRRWEMFRLGWVELYWPTTPVQPGAAVAVLARACGV